MAYLPPAQRALDVLAPIVVYRQIGRRPSAVYVNESMSASHSGDGMRHRLTDRVYWRTAAAPGDQVQDRPGGTLLVTASGQCYPVLLAEPRALDAATAFIHAELAIKADRARAEQLLAEGKLAEASPRRPKGPPSRPADRMLADEHPLIVETLSEGLSPEADTVLRAQNRPQWRSRG
jgi:hypothetical protein